MDTQTDDVRPGTAIGPNAVPRFVYNDLLAERDLEPYERLLNTHLVVITALRAEIAALREAATEAAKVIHSVTLDYECNSQPESDICGKPSCRFCCLVGAAAALDAALKAERRWSVKLKKSDVGKTAVMSNDGLGKDEKGRAWAKDECDRCGRDWLNYAYELGGAHTCPYCDEEITIAELTAARAENAVLRGIVKKYCGEAQFLCEDETPALESLEKINVLMYSALDAALKAKGGGA